MSKIDAVAIEWMPPHVILVHPPEVWSMVADFLEGESEDPKDLPAHMIYNVKKTVYSSPQEAIRQIRFNYQHRERKG